MKYTENEYKSYDPFFGDEADVKLRKVKLVRGRKEYPCFESLDIYNEKHNIAKGELHRYESALIDGSFFGSYRICLKCMDKFLDECN